MTRREPVLGSAGCQPAAFGSLPNAPGSISRLIVVTCSQQAVANYRLTARAPQKIT